VPWNKGKVTGAKPPLSPKHVWSIRTKLQIEGRARDLAMFNLRGCDVVAIRARMSLPADMRRIAQVGRSKHTVRVGSAAEIIGVALANSDDPMIVRCAENVLALSSIGVRAFNAGGSELCAFLVLRSGSDHFGRVRK
jgi:hypothetical protein